jgi:phage terminase large subunit-like protein
MTVLPPRYASPPLSEEYTSQGPQLRKLFKAVWTNPQTGKPLELEPWQEELIDRILETNPDGTLRYRQVVVVVPRQSGKSLIAGALTLYALFLHARMPIVVGTAGKTAEQAGIVFNRLKTVIMSQPALKKFFKRVTSTRGMELKNGGVYNLYPSKGDSVQGVDLTYAILDELHLAKPELWSALEYGQRAQDMSQVVAITTAGTENSILLNNLMATGRDLANNPDPTSRFGYFEWSAPEHLRWDSEEAVLASNPRVASGAIPIDRIMDSIKTTLPAEYQRYTLNWVTKASDSWLPQEQWYAAKRKWPELPDKPTVIHTEVTPGRTYATLSIACMTPDKRVHTQVLASIPNPLNSSLAEIIYEVAQEYPDITVTLDSLKGKDIGERLIEKGISVKYVTLSDIVDATAWAYNAVKKGTVTHDGASVLNRQINYAEIKVLPKGGYRVVPKKGYEADSVYAFLISAYMAFKLSDSLDKQVQLFIT